MCSAAGARDFDIPTGAPASPLFGAQPFSQEMLQFEEFGVRPIPQPGSCPGCTPLPQPSTCDGGPDGAALDAFLKQSLYPLPMREANTSLPNPWAGKIGTCVYPLKTSAIEGRPPGEYFAHQRFDEFAPSVYVKTAQAGGRTNGGLRDAYQRHGFANGEFAPGGLYYHNGTHKGVPGRFHPRMPGQKGNALWTFDGTLPPKLLVARYGEGVLFRQYNALPIDDAAHGGFGKHTITTHLHNGHQPGESDGFPGAFFFPGQYYDYNWAMILAGHDSINPHANEPRAATPDGAGGTRRIPGDWRETMSTLWFHDHREDHTAENVYKGNAAIMNIFSAFDRGREGFQCNYTDPANVNLCLPSGTALDWGNRDYDMNLIIADKAWDKDGQLYFNIFNTDGFLGDRMLVNYLFKPYVKVRARRYRLRLLNGSVSRLFSIAVVTAGGQRVPFHLIANDGNIMEHAVAFPNAQAKDLPAQSIGERFDIVVDFKAFKAGDKLYLVNVLEHEDGKGPKQAIPLADILSGRYSGDPAVGKFLELRVEKYDGQDRSMDPADYVEGKKTMIPRPAISAAELAVARHRSFEFGRSGGTDTKPWTIKTDGGQGLVADLERVSAAPTKSALEIWHFSTPGGWAHPVHVHFEEARILARDGGPPRLWEKWARKDMFSIGNTAGLPRTFDVALRFREFMGTFVEHCHNTQHEDRAMLLRWDVRNPGQTIAISAPHPRWEGVVYTPSHDLVSDSHSGSGGAAN